MEPIKQDLESRIIDAAKKEFLEKGFDKTSMSDIATAVGINRTTLHYYFRTKHKMFQAVFGSLVFSFLPKIQIIFQDDISFLDKLERVMDQYIIIFMENPSLPKFILGEVQRDINQLLAVMQELQFDQYLSSIREVVLKDMEEGRLKSVPLPVVFLTFYSQMTFPFLAKDLIINLFYENEESFYNFLKDWKVNVIGQMRSLLLY